MKKLTILLAAMMLLGACATTENALPFATHNRTGKYPVKRNKPVKHTATWTYRQWGHQGS